MKETRFIDLKTLNKALLHLNDNDINFNDEDADYIVRLCECNESYYDIEVIEDDKYDESIYKKITEKEYNNILNELKDYIRVEKKYKGYVISENEYGNFEVDEILEDFSCLDFAEAYVDSIERDAIKDKIEKVEEVENSKEEAVNECAKTIINIIYNKTYNHIQCREVYIEECYECKNCYSVIFEDIEDFNIRVIIKIMNDEAFDSEYLARVVEVNMGEEK